MKIRLEWNPHDLWIGAYFTYKPRGIDWFGATTGRVLHVYVCLIPMVPLHVEKVLW